MERDSCSKNEAMSRARQEHPREFQTWQAALSSSPTNEQATRRAGRGVGKAMPMDYESLVSAEMRKGASWRCAENRVINAHGSGALRNRMMKSEDLSHRFAAIVKRLSFEHQISMEEATRMARHRNPALVKAMNSV
jgi:hypothetical protein